MASEFLVADQSNNNLSIFLLGKTGSGKSRTGNSILGKPFAFKFGTQTDECSVETTVKRLGEDEKTIHVIDTSADDTTDHLKLNEIEKKINEYKENSIPIFIFCIQIGRFNRSDTLAYEKYKKCLGQSIFNHALVIFTCYDKWENDMEDLNVKDCSFKSYVSSLSHQNQTLLHLCGRRWVPFNNRLKGIENNCQVDNLFKIIDDMLELRKVCPSKLARLTKTFVGPEKKIADAGVVPSTQQLKQIDDDQTQNAFVQTGVAIYKDRDK